MQSWYYFLCHGILHSLNYEPFHIQYALHFLQLTQDTCGYSLKSVAPYATALTANWIPKPKY